MLDIQFGLLLFVAVLFLALIFILNKMLYQPLLAFMDKRDETIKDDMKSAKQMGNDVEEAQKVAHGTILEAKSQAHKIRESATAQAKEKAEKLIDSAKETIDSKYNDFTQSLLSQREELKKSISLNVPAYQKSIQNKLKKLS